MTTSDGCAHDGTSSRGFQTSNWPPSQEPVVVPRRQPVGRKHPALLLVIVGCRAGLESLNPSLYQGADRRRNGACVGGVIIRAVQHWAHEVLLMERRLDDEHS